MCRLKEWWEHVPPGPSFFLLETYVQPPHGQWETLKPFRLCWETPRNKQWKPALACCCRTATALLFIVARLLILDFYLYVQEAS